MPIQVDLPFDDANDSTDDSALDNPLSNSPLQGRSIRFGSKTIDFASEIEKAMYVLASKPRGTFAREQEFIQYLSQFGLSKAQISNFGRSIVSEVKRVSKSSGHTIDIGSFNAREKMAEVIRQSSLGYLFLSEEEQAERQRKLAAREKLRSNFRASSTQELISNINLLQDKGDYKPKYSIEAGKVKGGLPTPPDLFDQYPPPAPPTSTTSPIGTDAGGGGYGPKPPIDFIVDPEDEEGPKINRSHIKQRAKSLESQVLSSLRKELGKDLEASRARATEISAQASKSRAAGYGAGGLLGLPGYAFSTVLDSLHIRPAEEALRGQEASYQGSRKDEFSEQTFKIKEFFRQYIFDAVDSVDDEALAGVEDALKSLESQDRENIFQGISGLARGLADDRLLDDRVRQSGTGDVEGLDPSQFKKTARPGTLNAATAAFGPSGNLAKFSGYAVGAYAAIKGAQFVSSVPANAISSVGANLNASGTVSGQQGLIRNVANLDIGTALGVNPFTKGIMAMFDVVSQIEENTRKEYAFTTPDALVQNAMNQILMIQRMLAEGAERDPILAELTKMRGLLAREAEGLKTELLKTFGPLLSDVLFTISAHVKIVADMLSNPAAKALLRFFAGGGLPFGGLLATWGAYADSQLMADALKNNSSLLDDIGNFLDDDYFVNPANPQRNLDVQMNQGGRRRR